MTTQTVRIVLGTVVLMLGGTRVVIAAQSCDAPEIVEGATEYNAGSSRNRVGELRG